MRSRPPRTTHSQSLNNAISLPRACGRGSVVACGGFQMPVDPTPRRREEMEKKRLPRRERNPATIRVRVLHVTITGDAYVVGGWRALTSMCLISWSRMTPMLWVGGVR